MIIIISIFIYIIDEDSIDVNADDELSEINIEEWKKQQDLIGCFECSKINSDNTRIPGYVMVKCQ